MDLLYQMSMEDYLIMQITLMIIIGLEQTIMVTYFHFLIINQLQRTYKLDFILVIFMLMYRLEYLQLIQIHFLVVKQQLLLRQNIQNYQKLEIFKLLLFLVKENQMEVQMLRLQEAHLLIHLIGTLLQMNLIIMVI